METKSLIITDKTQKWIVDSSGTTEMEEGTAHKRAKIQGQR